VKPYLWHNGTEYPDAFSDLDFLFAFGEVDFSATHDVSGAQTGIDEGRYPAGSKVPVLCVHSCLILFLVCL
jgi:putative spermidine/putrescine transport system substrate-binding protein